MTIQKNILITGVSGFIGRYIADFLVEKGYSVFGIGKTAVENSLSNLAEYYCMNLPDKEFDQIIQKNKIGAIIHCAGRSSVPISFAEPENDFCSGPNLVFSILNSIRKYSPNTRFIFLSSAAVYGNPEKLPVIEGSSPKPISVYGYHKWMAELICKEFYDLYQIPTAIVRIFSAYGNGLKRQVVWDITSKLLKEKNLLLTGTGNETRDFIHVSDIAIAFECILEKSNYEADVYNVSSGVETSILELSQMILKYSNLNAHIQFDNKIPIGNPVNWKADIQKLKSLGFSPRISLEEGIKNFIQWAKLDMNLGISL